MMLFCLVPLDLFYLLFWCWCFVCLFVGVFVCVVVSFGVLFVVMCCCFVLWQLLITWFMGVGRVFVFGCFVLFSLCVVMLVSMC